MWEKTVFSTKGAGITGYLYGRNTNLDLHLTPYTKNDLIWIMNLNRKAKTRKLLEENLEKYLYDVRVQKYSLDKAQKAITIKTDKLYQNSNFFSSKDKIKKMNRQEISKIESKK